MGTTYTVILTDEYDWNYSGTDKYAKLRSMHDAFAELGKRSPSLLASWDGAIVLDLDKCSPLRPEIYEALKPFDAAYYSTDGSPTIKPLPPPAEG